MSKEIKYNDDPDTSALLLRSKEMDLESGYLGKFFGSPTHSPSNIAGLVVLMLITTGIFISFFSSSITPTEYWTIVVPIITLSLGYVFGKQS